jgi:hypothetical protein
MEINYHNVMKSQLIIFTMTADPVRSEKTAKAQYGADLGAGITSEISLRDVKFAFGE